MKAQSTNFKAQEKPQAPNSKQPSLGNSAAFFGAYCFELFLSFELCALSLDL
jgi:hypothetical protein